MKPQIACETQQNLQASTLQADFPLFHFADHPLQNHIHKHVLSLVGRLRLHYQDLQDLGELLVAVQKEVRGYQVQKRVFAKFLLR